MKGGGVGGAVLIVELPLPPTGLGKNGRVGWRAKGRLYRDHREYGAFGFYGAILGRGVKLDRSLRFVMDIEWRYSNKSHIPDDDNAIERCAAYRDAAEDVGLVNDDSQIETGRVSFERVKRGQEGVSLTFKEVPDATPA